MTDDDGGPQHRHRHAALAQQFFDLTAGLQVRGKLLVISTQTAQIDDPAHPGRRRRHPESPGCLRISLDEIAGIQ